MTKPAKEPLIHCTHCGSQTWVKTALPCGVCAGSDLVAEHEALRPPVWEVGDHCICAGEAADVFSIIELGMGFEPVALLANMWGESHGWEPVRKLSKA